MLPIVPCIFLTDLFDWFHTVVREGGKVKVEVKHDKIMVGYAVCSAVFVQVVTLLVSSYFYGLWIALIGWFYSYYPFCM